MTPSPARGREIVQRIALLLVASLLALIAADGIFRWYESRHLIFDIPFDSSRFDLARFGHNDEVGYIERERRPGELRILSFGDSFAVSPTIAGLAYSAVLGRELAERLPARTLRVVNLGQPKTSFDDYLRALRFWSARVEFDAVLVNLYMGNDFRETPAADAGRAHGSPPVTGETREALRVGPGVEVPHLLPLRMLDYWLVRFRARRLRADADAQYRPGMLWDSPDHYLRNQTRMLPVYRAVGLERFTAPQQWLVRLLAELESLRAGGAAVAVSIAPPDFIVNAVWRDRVLAAVGLNATDVDLDLPASLVRGVAERAGAEVPLIDLRPCLERAESQGERMYYGTNTHWSVSGNAVVGRVLAEVLADAWFGLAPLEPPACRTRPLAPSPPLAAYLDRSLDSRETPRQ